MTRLTRILTAAAALALIGLYFLPLWKVELQAPQYPEGIGMYIAISDIRGFSEFDLQKINNLNHYIGMQEIVPEAIPELRYMPWILAGLVTMGLGAAALGRRRLLNAWLVVLLVAGVAGLADFYRWGHDYGHNLDENAIIKVPGMSYQPPVIGRKQLLNFTAESWPATGGLLAGFAFALALTAAIASRKAHRERRSSALVGMALAAGACAAAAQPVIAYDGSETCEYCRMLVTDSRFGAAVVTAEGKTHRFDSIECLAGYVLQLGQDSGIRSVWVTDYARPGELTAVDSARFIQVSDGSGSPMGMGLRAIAQTAAPADAMEWSDVLELVGTERQPATAGR